MMLLLLASATLLCVASSTGQASAQAEAKAKAKPHIVFVMQDDLGLYDLGIHNKGKSSHTTAQRSTMNLLSGGH